MTVDFIKSMGYVGEKGSSLEKARLNYILLGTNPPNDVIQEFVQIQNDDGGFPFGMYKDNLSTVNETTVALWWMEELGMLNSSTSRQAFEYLLSVQQEDGSWDEDPHVAEYDLPAWIKLGDLKTRLYLSAYATYWLAVGGQQSLPAFRKAIHFLLRHQDQSGNIFGYLHNTWISVGAFLLAGDRYRNVANQGIQALMSRPVTQWEDSQIIWALDCLSMGNLSKKHPFIEGGLDELFHRQKADGSWASEDGDNVSIGATIQCLKVLKRFGLFSAGWDGATA